MFKFLLADLVSVTLSASVSVFVFSVLRVCVAGIAKQNQIFATKVRAVAECICCTAAAFALADYLGLIAEVLNHAVIKDVEGTFP